MLKYNQYIKTRLIKEALTYKENFLLILSLMKDNKIAYILKVLLGSENISMTDIDVDDKSGSYYNPKHVVYTVTKDTDQYPSSNRNFKSLGGTKNFDIGTEVELVKILNSASVTDYYIIKFGEDTSIAKLSTLDKKFLRKPTTSRIGRIVNKILIDNGVKFTAAELEEFNNRFRASQEFLKVINDKFEIVSGENIRKWYLYTNNVVGKGTLQSSCMRYEKCQRYLNIYVENKEIGLLVLKNEDSSLILGRALIWYFGDKTFMDRIYYTEEYQKELFIEYAKKNNFMYKEAQNANAATPIVDGAGHFKGKLEIKLEFSEFDYYPYMDTLKYLDRGFGLSNNRGYGEYVLEFTDGRYEDHDVCDVCGGSGELTCSECDGDGTFNCDNCDGSGNLYCGYCSQGTNTCNICDGSGTVDDKPCEYCDGTGDKKCEECHGDYRQDCDVCEGDGTYSCDNCGGSGNVDCYECN